MEGSASNRRIGIRLQTMGARLGWAVRPIFQEDHRHRLELVGSSVLLKAAERAFVITAAHVWDWREKGPLFIGSRNDLIELKGRSKWTQPPNAGKRIDDRIDLAFIEPTEGIVKHLSDCRFLTPDEIDVDDVAIPVLGIGSNYLVIGYPETRVDSRPPWTKVIPNPFFYGTFPVNEGEYQQFGIQEYSHVLLEYDRDTNQTIHGTRTGPDPHGVSGGGLWRFDSILEDNPASDRLVGIMIEYHEGPRRMIATRIGLVVEAMKSLYPEIALALPTPRRVTLTNRFI